MQYDLVESTARYIRITNINSPIEEERVQFFEINDPLENVQIVRPLVYGTDVTVDFIDGRIKVYVIPDNIEHTANNINT